MYWIVQVYFENLIKLLHCTCVIFLNIFSIETIIFLLFFKSTVIDYIVYQCRCKSNGAYKKTMFINLNYLYIRWDSLLLFYPLCDYNLKSILILISFVFRTKRIRSMYTMTHSVRFECHYHTVTRKIQN